MTEQQQPAPDGITFNVQWLTDASSVPAPVNQFIIQGGPPVGSKTHSDTFVLTFGHLTAPFATPMPYDEMEQFAAQSVAYVVPVARLTFTPDRLREFHEILGTVIATLDQP